MKANPMQKMITLLLVNALMAQDNLFVPMPVKSEAHLKELEKQAGKIMLDLAIEEREDIAEMAARMAADEKKSAAPADDMEEASEPCFDSLRPDQLYTMLTDVREKLLGSVKMSKKQVNEARGVVKLGFNKGVGMVAYLTTSQSVYDSAEHASFPGEENCGDPDCKGCNPEPTTSAPTIH